MNFSIKKITPYIVALIVFIFVAILYFSPILEGKKIQQGDITQFIGSSKEIVDFRKEQRRTLLDKCHFWWNAFLCGKYILP